ncbi:MAG: HAD hydrolase-like protein [Methylobacter sp.]
MALRIIILDFDGVVIESNDIKTHAFQQVFARFPEHTKTMMAFHREHVSLSRYAKFDHLLGLLGRNEDAALKAEIATDFSLLVVEKMKSVPMVPGAEDFLRNVTPMLPVYLASVTPAEELSMILGQRGLMQWFRDIYGCPPWTKQLAIQDILMRETVNPEDVLLIGDSAGDQQAAHITGVNFIARNSGLSFDSPQPLIFTAMNEITQYVEKLLP